MIRALIFDFDGLILETEEPSYRSWKEVYQSFGFTTAIFNLVNHHRHHAR